MGNQLKLSSFDRLTENLFRNMIGFETLINGAENAATFPPYNIVRVSDSRHEIQVALAGYSKDDIEVNEDSGVLHIKSVEELKTEKDEDSEKFQYKGIAKRKFELRFQLGRGFEVINANMSDGMLLVSIGKTENENLKKIEIL